MVLFGLVIRGGATPRSRGAMAPPRILMMVNYTTVVGLNGYNCIIWPPFYVIICHVIITSLIFWTI